MDAPRMTGRLEAMDLTVVIPNFNGMEGLKVLLPELCRRQFPAVYLLDDCSTDQSVPYAKSFPGIRVMEGDRNRGPGGNRNRILQVENPGEILWFIDADMELVTTEVLPAARRLFGNPDVAMVGGMILTRSGEPYYWNYGYEKHPIRDGMASFYGKLGNRFRGNRAIWDLLRKRAIRYFYGMEIDSGVHPERTVEWVAEGNFLIRTDVFRRLGGFDENMRYHEAHDLCKRIRQAGGTVRFSPDIVTRHLEVDCRDGGKPMDWKSGERYFYRKHWGTPRDAFRNFFRCR
jgi:N-acetylglucosaminyl-diphospho-decaprenol L-rhamnosyltransferase